MIGAPKRDFGTLRTGVIVREGLARMQDAGPDADRAEHLALIILESFDDYYSRSRQIPWLAKTAFEERDWPAAIDLSQERIAIYSVAIAGAAQALGPEFDAKADGTSATLWQDVEAHYHDLVAGRYEWDLAEAFLASLRRVLHRDTWEPVTVEANRQERLRDQFVWRLEASGRMTAELAARIIAVPGICGTFRDLEGDTARVAEKINDELGLGPDKPLKRADVLDAGFYRNRGAYIIGALRLGETSNPLALALLHREQGIEIDAVILRETTLSHVFSSTLANLHVTMTEYHELVDFLHELMPLRPRGMHYSTVGYNHVGKQAVMQQISAALADTREPLTHAPGPEGSVAMALTAPSLQYVLKIIRDRPTDNYKWDRFDGKESVLAKYRSVHELNRSGSMLDNIIYSNVALPRSFFDAKVLEQVLDETSESVRLTGDRVLFAHLIVQRKLVPVPLFLENCTPEEAEKVVIRLGQCIRNNAATNVFNKDLDGRNYGVSSLRFVYLFDYDAVEHLSDVKVRTNADREAGEEEPPDWVFEDGIIFLPEEIEAHLRLPDRRLRRLFREAHGELLTVEYWTRMQRLLREGHVPRVRTYPRACQLSLQQPAADLTLSPVRAG